jgi:putative hydrolase of the HAD superfamily
LGDDDGKAPGPRPASSRPLLLAVVQGGVASGKSSVAKELARRLGAVRIAGDLVRADLLSHASASVHEGAAWRTLEPGFEVSVYEELLRRADGALSSGHAVVLDACFPSNAFRLTARGVARRLGAAFVLVECAVPDEVVRARLRGRDAEGDEQGWQEIHDDLAQRWEPVSGIADEERVAARSDGEVGAVVSGLLAAPPFRRLLDAAPGHAAPGLVSARPAAVTFDCWNTLLYEDEWQTAHALRIAELRAAAQEAGRSVSREESQRAFDLAWNRHMRLWTEGIATGAREVAQWALAELGLADPHPALEHLVWMFQGASHSSRVCALPGARETLVALARAGIPCALVCDTGLTPGRVVRRHLDRLGLLEGLAVQIFSDEVGVPKPDPRVFRAALEPLGVTPERALHVGDLRRTDVAGGRAVGMTTVRISGRHDDESELPEADHVVGSHAELVALLEL